MTTRASGSGRRRTPTQARAARRTRRQNRRRMIRIGAFAAVGLIAAIFILSLILPSLPLSLRRGSGPDGPGLRLTDQGRTHINLGEGHAPYNSVPATSGWHYGQPQAPARWGVHDEPLDDEVLVHNLEHGGVGVYYNCPDGCDELVEQLAGIVRGADQVIMTPRPDMDSRIALTAWTFIDKFEEFDEQRVREFISAHVDSPNSPEASAR